MISFVVKKDGSKAAFDSSKTKNSIIASAKEAGFDQDKAEAVANEISTSVLNSFYDQDTVLTSEIKNRVLAQLDSSYPEVSAAWRKYDQEHGK